MAAEITLRAAVFIANPASTLHSNPAPVPRLLRPLLLAGCPHDLSRCLILFRNRPLTLTPP
jgi:hypothetical protein